MDVMTMKMDAQYKEMKSRTECNHYGGNHSTADCNDDDTPMSREEEAKFMQTFRQKMEAQYRKFLDMIRAVRTNVPLVDVLAGMPNYGKFLKELKQLNLGVDSESMVFSIDSAMKHSYSNDDTCFSIDVIGEILEEDFDALLDEGSKILYFIKGTPLEDKIFAEFDEFIAMNIKENTKPKINEEETPFEKITFDTNYKIKKSLEEPPTDLELKPHPDHLEYAFLEEPHLLLVNILS
nr:reverse transcriptase domain-containing protein [Tanacetum cinerariifolium]